MGVRKFNVMDLSQAKIFEPREVGYQDSIDIIHEELHNARKSIIKIGWYLKHIYEKEMYMEDGYSNIYEFAYDKFKMSQSTVTRSIQLCQAFSVNHDSPELEEKYADFNISQLFEMLPMQLEQIETVTPDMTVRQIREIKKNDSKAKSKEVYEGEEADLKGQTSLEEDFPEYLPDSSNTDASDQQKENATSHKGQDEEEAEESDVIDGTCREIQEQPNLPELKNNDQRKEWLANYKAWGLWYRDENIDVNYYKYDFPDGSRLVVAEYPQRQSYYSRELCDECFYHLLEKNKKRYEGTYDEVYRHREECETYLVEFLKNLQKGGGIRQIRVQR